MVTPISHFIVEALVYRGGRMADTLLDFPGLELYNHLRQFRSLRFTILEANHYPWAIGRDPAILDVTRVLEPLKVSRDLVSYQLESKLIAGLASVGPAGSEETSSGPK